MIVSIAHDHFLHLFRTIISKVCNFFGTILWSMLSEFGPDQARLALRAWYFGEGGFDRLESFLGKGGIEFAEFRRLRYEAGI